MNHPGWFESVHGKTLRLLIILTDDEIKYTCSTVGLITGRQAGMQASRQNMGGFWNFKDSLQVKLFRFLFHLILLQYVTTV